MKAYLNKFGVWEIVVNPPIQSNKMANSATQKDAKKDNAIALKFLMNGLSSSIRECKRTNFNQRPMVQAGN